MSSLETLKYGGITQEEMCFIVLHVLQLLTATITCTSTCNNSNGDEDEKSYHYTLKFDTVGQLYKMEDQNKHEHERAKPIPLYQNKGDGNDTNANTIDQNDHIKESFALPTPAREALLSFVIMILTKDRYLRPVSNQSFIIPEEEETDSNHNDCQPSYSSTSPSSSLLLVIEWKALLRLLLRTAPYLDETRTGKPNHDSLSKQNTVLKRTVSMIRYSRRFFNQGTEVKRNILTDATAAEVWDMVYPDLVDQTHSNACYRAVILLHLFFPTRCSSKFYVNIMPVWLDCWSSIDRCPEFDFLWINMFCRSRRFLREGDYDWGPLRRRLLTLCGYWLQIPVGGRSSDKTFPRAAEAKSRNIPSRLKSFVRNDSSYQEGVDFVAKVSKLLVFCCGKNDGLKDGEQQSADPLSSTAVSHGTEDLLRFFSFVGPYFNPSNTGSWTFPLGVMLHYISFELCRRIGRDSSQVTLSQTLPMLASTVAEVEPFKLNPRIPDHEIALILDSILPLCQQALYSKSSHVSRAGEAALLYLAQIDYKICAPLLDFAMRALDISSVTQSHQAPAALSTMNRLILPSLKRSPSILLERLPDILRLSLAGIDSNDEDKTIRTLVFYRTLTSWIPVGHEGNLVETVSSHKGGKDEWRFGEGGLMKISTHDIDSKAYWGALKRLPTNSILFQKDDAQPLDQESHEVRLRTANLAEEAGHAMADWSISFLDRIYGLFRAAGEQEKIGKSHRFASKRSSAEDVARARHFTRILKECLRQIFAAMDSETFICAMNSVTNFLINETHPLAVKYASALCESIAAARADEQSNENMSPGFSNLVMPLTAELRTLSNNSILYRVRCLSGAVRRAGAEVLNYREHVLKTLDFTLAHQNKHIFKAGCKLLRHTLSSQCESYPLATDSSPRIGMLFSLGESAQLSNDKTKWHVPSGAQINFVAELLSTYVYNRIKNIPEYSEFVFVENSTEMDMDNKISSKQQYLMEWRRCLRVLRYTVRGCPGLLLETSKENQEADFDPNEHAAMMLIDSSSPTSRSLLLSSRERISKIIISLLSLIAKESSSHDATIRISKSETSPRNMNITTLIASDTKICKEVAEISQLLFSRRSASFRGQDAFNLWKAQKDVTNDRVVLHHRKEIGAVLQKAGCLSSTLLQTYSDGEEGGKLLPRRMVSNRVEIFLHSFQRSSSFDIPRRLKRERGSASSASLKLLSFNLDIESFNTTIEKLVDIDDSSLIYPTSEGDPLAAYEAILDGMFALTCHHSSSVRGYGIRAVEYGFSRFGWLAKERAPRLIAAISLGDQEHEAEYGLISCSRLSLRSEPSLRKRLAEVLKGACLMLVVPRVMKQIMSSEEQRIKLVEALCGTQHVISLLPAEEMQKMLSYFHQIFSTFRSRFYTMPVMTKENEVLHQVCLAKLLDLLKEKKNDDSDLNSSSLNWRNRLLVCWFVTTLADKRYFLYHQKQIVSQMWETCIFIIQTESGQPLQKVALGLLGRLINLSQQNSGQCTPLLLKMNEEDFCRDFCKALVYNHKEDQSVGGGHHAQWSLGVNEIIRDSASNLAPKMMFPFLRVGRSNGHFKVTHVQPIHAILENLGAEAMDNTVRHLLSIAKEMASSPPSEDQRNQLCTSAEVFCGVFVSLLNSQSNKIDQLAMCNRTLLPFLDAVIEAIPSSVLGAFLDAIRYGMTKIPHSLFGTLCSWSISKIENSLWRPEDTESSFAVDGFAEQSKWLAVMNVILIQMDFSTDSTNYVLWNTRLSEGEIYSKKDTDDKSITGNLADSWINVCTRLLPRLLDALGHPYQSCRERIASVLFRIAYCYRSQGLYEKNGDGTMNPCATIVNRLLSLSNSTDKLSKVHQHSLITSRLFLSYCVHHGEVKQSFTNYIIPLLPLAFDAIKPSIDEDETKDDDPEIRMLQAQVIKAYRHSISEISVSCTAAYGNSFDLSLVLKSLDQVSTNTVWQLRLAVAHFLRCFQGNHKFLFTTKQTKKTTKIVARLLADERREVSAVAMAALTGILAATPRSTVAALVEKYRKKANNSVMKKTRKKKIIEPELMEKSEEETVSAEAAEEKEKERAVKQQTSVYFLCAAVLATPYETPPYVPVALAALSKHSYERSAPFAVRETVKMCCAEYKRTHRSDNWEIHRQQFTREQLEALEDVVSTPHYYA